MRKLSKVLLLAMAAFIALTAMTTTAPAHNLGSMSKFEIREERDDGQTPHCPAVSLGNPTHNVTGGCLIHVKGTAATTLRKHVFGVESNITTCDWEFHLRINEHGIGHIYEQVFTGAGCTRQACSVNNMTGEKLPWMVEGFEGTPEAGKGTVEGREYLDSNLCVEPTGGGTDEFCQIEIPFQQYTNPHRQEWGHLSEIDGTGFIGFRCELLDHWITETGGMQDMEWEDETIVTHTT